MEKYSVKDRFIMVCAETNRHRLPKEIDRVPAIIIDGSRVLFEDEIVQYLQSFASPQERVSGCGGMFSYIDDNEDAMLNDGGGYGIFGQEQKIYTPPEDGDTGNVGGKVGSINYDRLVSERDMDIKRFIK